MSDEPRVQRQTRMREKPGFPGNSRVSWAAGRYAGMGGCLGRDRTQTFPIGFRPLKYREKFASKASFSCRRLFGLLTIEVGARRPPVKNELRAVFRALDGTQAVRFARGVTSAFIQRSPLLCREQSFDFGYCVARPRGLPPAKRKDRGWQVTLWVEVNARCASPPAFARCEGIHIAFPGQQKFQET